VVDTAATVRLDPADGRRAYRWRLIRSLLLGQVSTGASLTIIALATAEIAAELHTKPSVVAWAVTGGVLASAIGAAIGGKLGDVHGHRRVYRIALFVVAVLTGVSALAWSGPSFLVARVVAGFAAGAASANSTAMVLHAFPLHERTKAMGIYQAALTLAPALGLLVGGPMIDAFGWRTMFWLFTALVVIGWVWAFFVVEERGERMPRRIDYLGSFALAGTVVSVLLFFDRAKTFGLGDPVPMITLACAFASAGLFVLVESRVEEPLFRLDYFRRRNFIVPTMVGAGLNFAFMGGLVVTPLLMHREFGYSNTAAASVLFLRPMSYSITAVFAGQLQNHMGTRATSLTGGATVVLSMVLFAVGSAQEAILVIVAGLTLSGLGLGVATPGLTVAAANASDPQDFGVSTGMRTTITQVGVTAGIQSMTIALGTSYTPEAFAGSFWLGCAVASAATLLALAVRD
jgi:MFS family permease